MDLDQSPGASVAYLVHDLNDAAVRRRVELLADEGFVVGLGGFRRHAPALVATASRARTVLELGRTQDARLGQRAIAVARALFAPGAVRALCADAGVIVARNLEMLVLAARVRAPGQRLVYECLDIHRLMLGAGRKSRLMRWIERRLLARTDLVIVSSPAFARHYFAGRQGRHERVMLVENKLPGQRRASSAVVARPGAAGAGSGARAGTPCVIGWFGMLRCRKSFDQLAAIARLSQGRIEVVVAGVPSPAEFPDFEGLVAASPGLRYAGRFTAEDLPGLYGAVDLVWAIDYFEEGLNSDWLLPNRLYEGLAHGVVPIARPGVETGRWLQRRGVGLLVDDPVNELPGRLAAMTADEWHALGAAACALPSDVLYQTAAERRAIAAAVMGHDHG